ncbi:DUF6259 domain-containing protein [Kineococcus esterisolvens]|uniref:DUF6259 domain-containing protein n=1 Tax=unclassified Kineococcus TaxID=2621656 RepID=UPI003D7D7BE8
MTQTTTPRSTPDTTAAPSAAPAPLVLRDEVVEVTFDAHCGGITRIRDLAFGDRLRLTRDPALFVLEVPCGGDRTVVVATGEQRLSSAEPSGDGRSLVLTWDGLVTSAGERLAASLRVTARLDGRGALHLALDAAVDGLLVEAVRFPSLRGLRAEADGRLTMHKSDYSQGSVVELLPAFESNAPYWGTVFPDHASGNLRPEVVCNPTAPFVVLAAASGGLSVQPAEPTTEFIGWRASLEPGYRDSLLRSAQPLDGEPAVTFDAVQVPAVRDDGGLSVLPVVVAAHRGDWTAGLAAYRRTQRPARTSPARWLAEPRSWLQVQLRSTEGETRYDFDDLTGIVEECAAAGIGAVQVVGWNEGGQDGLVPVHRPARGLGGEEGLRRALRRAHELDVAAVLYVKYQWVERPGPHWERLARHACLDENGQTYAQPGPVYHTSRKRYGMSTPSYVPLCFSSQQLREEFAREVAEMAAWGAAGVLADESLYHGRALLCFAEDHGHRPGASAYDWDGDFVEDLRRAAAQVREDFVVVGEGCYDGQFEHYDSSYFRSASERHVPLGRVLRPGVHLMTALTGFDDRGTANQCLLHGYAMSLEPFHFKGRPSDAPGTVAYARAVDDVRRALAPWLWRGRYLGQRPVTDASGSAHRLAATAWERSEGPGGGCVVVVNVEDAPRTVHLDLQDVADPLVVRVGTGVPAGVPLAGPLEVPARGAVVVIGAADAPSVA